MVVLFEHDLPALIRMIPSFQSPFAKRESVGDFEVERQRNTLDLVRVLEEALYASTPSML